VRAPCRAHHLKIEAERHRRRIHRVLGASPDRTAGPPDGRCILVDSDAALDDFRAVAALARTGRIAIVTTEDVSKPSEGAGAMEALLRLGGLSISVIAGASPNPDRLYRPDPRLKIEWCPNAEA